MFLTSSFQPGVFVYGFAYAIVSLAEREEGWSPVSDYGETSELVAELRDAASLAMRAYSQEPCALPVPMDFRAN